jgi:hypothetical protein
MTSPSRDRRLVAVDDELWTVDAPQRFMGFEIGTRMTVVRLSSGELWLCSPVAIDDGLADALEALGPVAYVVGPNRYHHLHLGPTLKRFPDAVLHLAPGLADKRRDLPRGNTLSSTVPRAWATDLDQRVIEGVPTFNEVAFLHRRTRTLILTDHLFHLDRSVKPASARLLGRMLGVHQAPGFPRDARVAFVKDEAALAASIRALLTWDFDRVILTHGRCVEEGGKAALAHAYASLLQAPLAGAQ